MNKIFSLAVIIITLGGCSVASTLHGPAMGSSHGTYFADQSKEVAPSGHQKGSSHGNYVADQSTEKVPAQSRRPLSLKE